MSSRGFGAEEPRFIAGFSPIWTNSLVFFFFFFLRITKTRFAFCPLFIGSIVLLLPCDFIVGKWTNANKEYGLDFSKPESLSWSLTKHHKEKQLPSFQQKNCVEHCCIKKHSWWMQYHGSRPLVRMSVMCPRPPSMRPEHYQDHEKIQTKIKTGTLSRPRQDQDRPHWNQVNTEVRP